jgi:hypothetical protein
MGLAGIDDGLELGVGEQLVDIGREVRPIARLGGRPRPSPPTAPAWSGAPVRRRYGSPAAVFFVDAVGQAAAFAGVQSWVS